MSQSVHAVGHVDRERTRRASQGGDADRGDLPPHPPPPAGIASSARILPWSASRVAVLLESGLSFHPEGSPRSSGVRLTVPPPAACSQQPSSRSTASQDNFDRLPTR